MNKNFYIGIDSDGTAFDSMTAKHELSFIPALFEVWDFKGQNGVVTELEMRINLFSKTRGVNRFPGLLMLFRELAARKIFAYDFSAFGEFVEKGESMSNAGLEKFMQTNNSLFLKDVLEWSKIADALFEKETENLMPFKGVLPALKAAAADADIYVISSASTEGLRTDWQKDSLSEYVTRILGQDSGTKKQQLKNTAEGRYPAENTLMLGDALSDMDAAKSINALFFPIIPGKEEECWARLKDEALAKFFSGGYAGEYEEGLIRDFREVLK